MCLGCLHIFSTLDSYSLPFLYYLIVHQTRFITAVFPSHANSIPTLLHRMAAVISGNSHSGKLVTFPTFKLIYNFLTFHNVP